MRSEDKVILHRFIEEWKIAHGIEEPLSQLSGLEMQNDWMCSDEFESIYGWKNERQFNQSRLEEIKERVRNK